MLKIEERIRVTPLHERIEVCETIVGDLCEKGRHIKMSLPVNATDEDLMLSITLQDCRNRIKNLEQLIIQMRMDDVSCNIDRDILDTLAEAMYILPTCGTLSILDGASQEIQALRASEIHYLSNEANNAKGNQRRPLNLTATSATLLPAVWLTQLLALLQFIIQIILYKISIYFE